MSHKITITLQPLGTEVKVNSGTPLKDVLHEFGMEFPCGGKGICGACKIKLLKGELAADDAQLKRLQKLKLSDNWRLACFCMAESDITLELSQFDNIILADNTNFDFEPQKGYGVAVDLGTTTVVAQMVNLENGHILDSVSTVNPQARFGADLIARIQACLDGNQTEMQQLIRIKIGEMIGQMLAKHPVEINKVSIVGNTVMHHIFCGFDLQPLSMYPFNSPNMEAGTFQPRELGWKLPANAEIRFHANIGSFVGSDILAGIAATKMARQEEYSLLIDLGTNGEIVLGNQDRIVCASTAAGPAFEGARISRGMRAATGAISSLTFNGGKMVPHVIGNAEARGICGSGLIDAVAILLEQQQIGMFGEINSGEEAVQITPKVALTQQDIREFQLAKAALATGVQLLIDKLGISTSEIKKAYIAGGFGNFLNIKNVIRTGLIECREEKITKLGNTALIGAKMFLFDGADSGRSILEKTTHINLEGEPNFQDVYIEKMMLM